MTTYVERMQRAVCALMRGPGERRATKPERRKVCLLCRAWSAELAPAVKKEGATDAVHHRAER